MSDSLSRQLQMGHHTPGGIRGIKRYADDGLRRHGRMSGKGDGQLFGLLEVERLLAVRLHCSFVEIIATLISVAMPRRVAPVARERRRGHDAKIVPAASPSEETTRPMGVE